MAPSEYFYRQCLIWADPDESLAAQMVEHVGADYFIWASDYPYLGASMGVVRELRERLALSAEARRKVLGRTRCGSTSTGNAHAPRSYGPKGQ